MYLDKFVDEAFDQLAKAVQRKYPKAGIRLESDHYKAEDRGVISNLTEEEFKMLLVDKDILFFLRVYSDSIGLRWKVKISREEDMYANPID